MSMTTLILRLDRALDQYVRAGIEIDWPGFPGIGILYAMVLWG